MVPNTKASNVAPVCSAIGKHGGKEFVVTMIQPKVSSDGKRWPKSAQFARRIGTTEVPTDVHGIFLPATFEVSGLTRPVTFSIGVSNILTNTPITIATLRIGHSDNPWGIGSLGDNDIPRPSALVRAALKAAAIIVTVSPGDGFGEGVILAVGANTRRDEMHMLLGERRKLRQPGEAELWDSPAMLRAVAREYKAAPAKSERPGVGIEKYIGGVLRSAPGTVRRQITLARKSGLLTGNSMSKKRAKE